MSSLIDTEDSIENLKSDNSALSEYISKLEQQLIYLDESN